MKYSSLEINLITIYVYNYLNDLFKMDQELAERGVESGVNDASNRQDDDGDSIKKHTVWAYLCKSRLFKAGLILLLVIAAGATSGGITYYACANDPSTKCDCQENSRTAGQSGVNALDSFTINLPLRIDPTSRNCEKPNCLNITHDIVRSTAIGEPYQCPYITVVKNSSCFLCNDQCLSFDDMRLEMGRRLCGVTVDCCVIAQMGQLERVCGDNGVYTCFAEKVHELYNRSHYDPICDCGAGFMGNKCNGVNNDKVPCTCYKTSHKFINEEDIHECSEVIHPSWPFCHARLNKENGEYNCLCKTNGTLSSSEFA